MLYELRIYTIHPGKMDAINHRFSTDTLGIFKRLGMKVIDFWIDDEGRDKLYYVMEFRDRDERDRQWGAFKADSEWVEISKNSVEDGPIVEKIEEIFMKRADYFRR
jgi:hypothetical protein